METAIDVIYKKAYEKGRADEREKDINERADLLAFICKKYSIPLMDMNCTVEEWEELRGGENE